MTWWLWIVLGLVLVGVEMLTPGGFYVLFFGVGALSVGALVAVDLAGPAIVQWLLFPIVSVAALALFRKRLLDASAVPGAGHEVDSLRQDAAILLEDLPLGGVAKVELRGTSWNARNAGEIDLRAGQRCRVERVEGLTLWVRAE